MKQSEAIKHLSDQELKKSLILSQLLFVFLAIIASIILFDDIANWLQWFHLDIKEIIYFGVCSGLLIVFIDLILMYTLPKRYYDDGGINERIFKALNFKEIFFICILIAFSEELLFRGIIQTTFGYIPASIVFALVHIRYLTKPVLFISVLLISFYIGYIFEVTSNLYVTMVAHFTVDFLLGIIIRYQK